MTKQKDNSYGAGYYPLPTKLRNLSRFSDAFHKANVIEHKVFPDEGVHMITVDTMGRFGFSIMRLDMESLLRLGLVRMQSNRPGTMAFYFFEKDGPSRIYPSA
jgi:hypothetical protein